MRSSNFQPGPFSSFSGDRTQVLSPVLKNVQRGEEDNYWSHLWKEGACGFGQKSVAEESGLKSANGFFGKRDAFGCMHVCYFQQAHLREKGVFSQRFTWREMLGSA